MVSKVFEHPFDLCKVRLQAQVLDATARFKGPVDCLTTTWKKEGVRGLYRVSCSSRMLALSSPDGSFDGMLTKNILAGSTGSGGGSYG